MVSNLGASVRNVREPGGQMDVLQLRSWLVRTDSRTEIYVSPDLAFDVSFDDFAATVAGQIGFNSLPVTAGCRDISWDDASGSSVRIVAHHNDPKLAGLHFVAGLERVGHFYYVEEKQVWETPNLPPAPNERLGPEPKEIHWLWWIVITVFTYGLGLLAIPWHKSKVRKAHEAWEETRRQTEVYDAALQAWIDRVMAIDKQARTDDELGRTFQALRSTLRQSVQKLFIDRHAELREQKEREVTRQELEVELEKRKQQGFQA